ncbi:MAG: hypothetical protein QM704_12795 [Anaeromyxobacteraceae bacterium]
MSPKTAHEPLSRRPRTANAASSATVVLRSSSSAWPAAGVGPDAGGAASTSSAAREKRRCPPSVRSEATSPAWAQRFSVATEILSIAAASDVVRNLRVAAGCRIGTPF